MSEVKIGPFLKWVGGKSQILDKILENIPCDINNYHEIFVGGGSVLFGILTMIKNEEINLTGNIYAYDINEALINTYKCVQVNPVELYANILIHIENYNKCSINNGNKKPTSLEEAITSKESYYYWIRNQFNSIKINSGEINYEKSSMFIFLNKTCFRGLYRESKNGFNVPFGNYKTPEIANLEHLKKVSNLIQEVNFICVNFEKSMLNVKEGDFVYLDPPYAPENETSFTRYSIEDFTLDSHNTLFKMIKELPCPFLTSNSNVPLVNSNFSPEIFNVKTVSCKRTINSKNPGAKTLEVLISNFI